MTGPGATTLCGEDATDKLVRDGVTIPNGFRCKAHALGAAFTRGCLQLPSESIEEIIGIPEKGDCEWPVHRAAHGGIWQDGLCEKSRRMGGQRSTDADAWARRKAGQGRGAL